jgi:hypothetical protein
MYSEPHSWQLECLPGGELWVSPIPDNRGHFGETLASLIDGDDYWEVLGVYLDELQDAAHLEQFQNALRECPQQRFELVYLVVDAGVETVASDMMTQLVKTLGEKANGLQLRLRNWNGLERVSLKQWERKLDILCLCLQSCGKLFSSLNFEFGGWKAEDLGYILNNGLLTNGNIGALKLRTGSMNVECAMVIEHLVKKRSRIYDLEIPFDSDSFSLQRYSELCESVLQDSLINKLQLPMLPVVRSRLSLSGVWHLSLSKISSKSPIEGLEGLMSSVEELIIGELTGRDTWNQFLHLLSTMKVKRLEISAFNLDISDICELQSDSIEELYCNVRSCDKQVDFGIVQNNPKLRSLSLYAQDQIFCHGSLFGMLLSDDLQHNCHLNELDLDCVAVGDSDIASIFTSLQFNSTLTILNVCHEKITDQGLVDVAAYIHSNTGVLEFLSIGGTFSETGFSLLGDALKVNRILMSLAITSLSTLSQPSIVMELLTSVSESNSTLVNFECELHAPVEEVDSILHSNRIKFLQSMRTLLASRLILSGLHVELHIFEDIWTMGCLLDV